LENEAEAYVTILEMEEAKNEKSQEEEQESDAATIIDKAVTEAYVRQIESLVHALSVQKQESALLEKQYSEQIHVAGVLSQQLNHFIPSHWAMLEFLTSEAWSKQESVLEHQLSFATQELEHISIIGSSLLSQELFVFNIQPSFLHTLPQSSHPTAVPFSTTWATTRQQYSMVNDLRLGNKPKPSDGLKWEEINMAWATLAQAMFFLAPCISSSSMAYFIVPLSKTCAKIMQVVKGSNTKYVHNLGNEDSRKNESDAIQEFHRALNAFHQVLFHLTVGLERCEPDNPPPYKIQCSSIGAISFKEIESLSDHEWSAIIHMITALVRWLVTHGAQPVFRGIS